VPRAARAHVCVPMQWACKAAHLLTLLKAGFSESDFFGVHLAFAHVVVKHRTSQNASQASDPCTTQSMGSWEADCVKTVCRGYINMYAGADG
jgi:hypothetical protein